MSRSPDVGDEFTPEVHERIRAHIKARGMTFEVFLPESLATWLRAKLAAGVFSDAKEAAFVAFQHLQELEEHPDVRKQLSKAVIEDALNDPRPANPIEQWMQERRTQWRRWADTEALVANDTRPRAEKTER